MNSYCRVRGGRLAFMDADYYIKNKCAARNRQRTACQRHAIELRLRS